MFVGRCIAGGLAALSLEIEINMNKRTAIVTGGMSGIGLATANLLAKSGHRIAVGSRRITGGQLSEQQGHHIDEIALVEHLDVGCGDSIDRFVGFVTERLGTPQILVNAAGIYKETFLDKGDSANWFEQIDVNLCGPYRMIRAVFPGMIRSGWGRIVNIASTAASTGASGYAGYCASKAGLVGLTRAVSKEGAPHGISCVSISPTWVETPMMERALQRHVRYRDIDIEQARANITESNPQGRVVQPGEIAALVAFCCSEAAPALTNEDIQVNAGADW